MEKFLIVFLIIFFLGCASATKPAPKGAETAIFFHNVLSDTVKEFNSGATPEK